MLVIGLTGGIGSGKSTVAKLFAELNIEIIDCDKIANELLQQQTMLDKIQQQFGQAIVTHKGLDKTALRDLIFTDKTAKQWLEQLLHPPIRNKVAKAIEQATSDYVLVEIPLLAESTSQELHNLLDRVLVIDCAESEQIKRASNRDNTPAENINLILANQASREQRLAIADDVIDNSGNLQELEQQVAALHTKYLELA